MPRSLAVSLAFSRSLSLPLPAIPRRRSLCPARRERHGRKACARERTFEEKERGPIRIATRLFSLAECVYVARLSGGGGGGGGRDDDERGGLRASQAHARFVLGLSARRLSRADVGALQRLDKDALVEIEPVHDAAGGGHEQVAVRGVVGQHAAVAAPGDSEIDATSRLFSES